MKNWDELEPDVYRLMNKHYTPGRTSPIRGIVLHHNAGVLTTEQCWNLWQTREASAHYQVETSGRIGQLVNDWDTAWHAGNANPWTIGIEHSNNAGAAQDWTISDSTIENGAHLVAALCRRYKLGRPEYKRNVFSHREFMQTSCPYHLAPGGKYHDRYMRRAQEWYDAMGHSHSVDSTPADKPHTERLLMALSDSEQRELLDKVRDIHTQLRGPNEHGWPQLGINDRGQNLTLVDAVAALRLDVARLSQTNTH